MVGERQSTADDSQTVRSIKNIRMKSRPPSGKGSRLLAAFLALGVFSLGAGAQVSDAGTVITSGVLDTSALSFYGFYGFYGVAGPNLSCGHVRFKYILYNYGAADLTTVNTIRHILDQSKLAVGAAVAEAAPELGPHDYSITLSELNGAAVTHVIVTADVDFGNNAQAGGRFLTYLGVTAEDFGPEGGFSETSYSEVPTARAEIAVQAVVTGYNMAQLQADENMATAFEGLFRGSLIASITSVAGQETARAARVDVFGIAEAGPDAVAVAANVVVEGKHTNGMDAYYHALVTDPYAVYPMFGGLAGQVKVTEVIKGAGDAKLASSSELADSSSGRKLLQNTRRDSNLARHLAEAGLGAASIQFAECPSVSSFYGFYGVNSMGSSAVHQGSSASGDFGSSASTTVIGSSETATMVASSGITSEHFSFYGTTSFYGTSFYGTSFYGTSFYGEEVVSSVASVKMPSFYGYVDANHAPSSNHQTSPSRPGESTSPSLPPGVQTYPIYFTAILSDYNMEDLTNPEDLEALKALYVNSVEAAVELIGIATNPVVSVLSVKAGSVAVDTLVLFINDPDGASLFQEVLTSNPAILFPAFSSVGSIYITTVTEEPPFSAGPDGLPGRVEPGNQAGADDTPNRVCSDIDRFGECCYSPAALDAKRDCCWDGVDECGVCGGNGNTCATSATVRVSTPFRSGLDDKTSTAFNQLLSDFRVAVSQLFESYSLDPFSNLDIDASAISVHAIDGTSIQLDVPFSVFPDPARGIAAPNLLRTKAILQAAAEQRAPYKELILIGLLDVSRVGVCGNGFCEYGELELRFSSSTCGIDCPGVYSCPVGDANSIVGDRSLQCVGRGACVQATGACKCDDGYTGPNCGVCAEGFSPDNGACYPADQVSSVDPADASDRSPSTPPTSDAGSKALRDILLGVLFGLLGVVLIVASVYWMVALRKRKTQARASGLAYRVTENPVSSGRGRNTPATPSGVISTHHEPEVPTRQVTETCV